MTTTRVKQLVECDASLDMRATQDIGREPADCLISDVEMNEFTINGKAWDEAKVWDFFHKRTLSPDVHHLAGAVWQFMEAIGDAEASDRREWEEE